MLIGLLAQGAVGGGAIGLLHIGGEQLKALFIEPLAQVAQPKRVTTLDPGHVWRNHDPGIACTYPLLQRIRPDHWQPQLVSPQMGNPQPVATGFVRKVLAQRLGQLSDPALTDQPADIFTQAAIDDAAGHVRLIGSVWIQAHATTHFRSLRVELSCASRLTASGAIRRNTPT